ncbi:(Fe-S)-binding protein [bacterium]|nr:(Fe-S)-binding protein [bacterium]MCB2179069.1 (Fe-S)-binding protein [bacterium]
MDKKIAIFVTCMVDQLLPEIGMAAVSLLQRGGFEVDFPTAQTCCGQPFFTTGFTEQAEVLAKQTIQILEPYSAVVVIGGSCTGMIREEYQHLFNGEPAWKARAVALHQKVFELSEFLAAHVPLSPKSSEVHTVTYHDSCHMLRIAGIKDQPRQLLEQVGCQIVEMEEPERCCGFGGAFSARMHEVSHAITREKLNQAIHTGTGLLVTADPGCLIQMRASHQEAGDLHVVHLAEILEELAA